MRAHHPFIQAIWPIMPAQVKRKLVRRIVVSGAESTGTTTLALALAEALNCPYVPEYGREYTLNRPHPETTPWKSEELLHIAETQNRLEDDAAGKSDNGWLVCDTDALTTALWHERYFGFRAADVDAEAARQHTPFIRLLTGDDIPFEADKIREGGEERHILQDHMRALFASGETPWLEVFGTPADRLTASLQFIHRQLRA